MNGVKHLTRQSSRQQAGWDVGFAAAPYFWRYILRRELWI